MGIGIGDWGLGIGDWGLGPIPNPQSPIPNLFYFIHVIIKYELFIKYIHINLIKKIKKYADLSYLQIIPYFKNIFIILNIFQFRVIPFIIVQ